MSAPSSVDEPVPGRPSRGWPRAAALAAVSLAAAVVHPSVLMAVPFLACAAVFGLGGISTALMGGLAVVVVTSGMPGDGMWFIERAWALLVAGFFVAVTLRRPGATFSARALTSVVGAAGVSGLVLGLRSGAWGTLDLVIRNRMMSGADNAIEAMRLLRGGDTLPATLVGSLYEVVESQASVFPAMLGISSIAALGAAWWTYRRLRNGDDQALGPLADFRFNDHLVWLFIGGLVLLAGGDMLARGGANVVVFMGALYALRGAAVVMFLSGGLSVFGYALFVLGMLFVPPLVLTGALVIGIGDTWLDARTRLRDLTT